MSSLYNKYNTYLNIIISAQCNEPPLPRRKKCPELAYKSHEFIIGSEYTGGDVRNSNFVARARVSV